MVYFKGAKKAEIRIPSQGKTPASEFTLTLRSTIDNSEAALSVLSSEVQGDYFRLIVEGGHLLTKGEYSYLLSFTDDEGEAQSFAGLAIRTGSPAIDIEEAESEIQYIQYE